jgi:hypothetical protein
VDAGIIYRRKSIPCLLCNPHFSGPPVLLALKENTNFTASDYCNLFMELFAMIASFDLVTCAVVIDNLPAQSVGLDQALEDTGLPIIHVKCFAHMTNLVLLNTISDPNLSTIMAELTELQNILRNPAAVAVIRRRCPKFVKTRWFYMVDMLAFLFGRNEPITFYLQELSREQAIHGFIPREVMELYAILLPYSCFISAVEARDCSLTLIVPLVRDLLAALRDVLFILQTTAARVIFRDMHIRLLSRISANNVEEAAASYLLTLEGRCELRDRERGYSTEGVEAAPEIRQLPDRGNLKHHVKSELGYDELMEAVMHLIAQSESITNDDDCPPSVFETEGPIDEISPDESAQYRTTSTYRDSLVVFACMPEQERLAFDPYHDLYPLAMACISRLLAKVDHDSDIVLGRFNEWLFADPAKVAFLQDTNAIGHYNSMWRAAHRHAKWMALADVALRLVSCVTSESDAERILSLQKNLAGLHGTRFTITGMADRLRSRILSREVTAPDLIPRVSEQPGNDEGPHATDEIEDAEVTDEEDDDSDGGSDGN